MEIKNLKKAAKRIIKAVKEQEDIVIYGDADLDGAASVIILEETIKTLGGKITHVDFPDRETEGYGINKDALNRMKKFAPALLIVIDCGISNFEEVEIAKRMGFEVIIIDHHEILEKLPKASIIVDPKQKGDKYPFKFFAATGLAFQLSKEIFGKKMTDSLETGFLEITALATIADMMPKTDDNLVFIQKGIKAVPNSWRPGIKAFFEIKELYDNGFERETISKIISLLNVKYIQDGIPAPYMVLTSPSVGDAKKIIELLIKKRSQRREELDFMEEQMDKEIAKTSEGKIIFKEYSADLDMLGSLASIVCNRHKKPTFIFRKRKSVCQGVTRMPEGIDGVDAMRTYKELFITYGGHPGAGGFTLKEENLKKFEVCMIKYFEKNKV